MSFRELLDSVARLSPARLLDSILSQDFFVCAQVFEETFLGRFVNEKLGRNLASAQAHCRWCARLYEEIRLQDECRGMDESSLAGLDVRYILDNTSYLGLNILRFRLSRSDQHMSVPVCVVKFVMVRIPEDQHGDSSAFAHTIPRETSSSSCRKLASRWIDDCMQNHSKCGADKIQWLPSRLVDVGLDNGEVKLVETHKLSKNSYSPYFALSHRWGTASDQPFRLLSGNRLALMEHIPIDQLTASLQDAIQYTRDMKVSYIWIDSMCIIQDSKDDWSAEAALMDRVYAQSLCTIAASYASSIEGSSNKRLFYTRDENDRIFRPPVCKTLAVGDHEETYQLSPKSSLILDNDGNFPLYKRAWVFQEQMLSPRTIHFGKQLLWECKEQRASETFPSGIPVVPENGNDDTTRLLPERGANLVVDPKDWKSRLRESQYIFWRSTLEQYLSCSLTYQSDKLVAFGAIAREYQEQLDYVYLAGLWKNQLPFCLIWAFEKGSSFPTRPKVYRCGVSEVRPTTSYLDIEVHAYDLDNTKFERVGLVTFRSNKSTFAKEHEAMSNFVLADDPLSGVLDTITIV
ncbi:hypothetical protein SS1G_02590 [Sclerotinia sclerotiorum 1980 UF-70]|uniref:Heterokaryon incompatibility domain-containing protein n=1 Tax=Sclerotinia sclerotiorum (strain ATCC 18683 / 1980 / Ss-1) TaxID=665079 RepID=A7EBA4_SCLS1|nr:hypothetical protein SS1G_02590 [Sclerotinia sclerotiorum 1980 UF-70]EDN99732.1 hypothetical protein SS1G_02590 [Sclerotinia sclerotiorum 1980 UF-70]